MKRFRYVFIIVLSFFLLTFTGYLVNDEDNFILSNKYPLNSLQVVNETYGEINIKYDIEDKELTITGQGKLDVDFSQLQYHEYYLQANKLIVEEGITEIKTKQFSGFSNLITVNLANSIEIIGSSAFNDCGKIETLVLPFIGSNKGNIVNNQNALLGYIFGSDNYDNSVLVNQYFAENKAASYYLPKNLKNVTVNGGSIVYGAFSYCSMIENVVVDEGVETVLENAFYSSTIKNLVVESININPNSLRGLSKLENLTVSYYSGLYGRKYPIGYLFGTNEYSASIPVEQIFSLDGKTLSKDTYYMPGNLTNIKVLQGDIYSGAFYNCTMLKSIELPYSNKYGKDAFYGCTNLTDVYYPFEIDATGWLNIEFENEYSNPMSYATSFYVKNEEGRYYELLELELNADSIDIGNYQFYGFDNLLKLYLSGDSVSIGDYAFYNCNNLVVESWIDSDITIVPENISIGNNAFYGCDMVGMLYIKSSNAAIVKNIGQPYYMVVDSGLCGDEAKYILCEGGLLYIYGYGNIENETVVIPGDEGNETEYIYSYDIDVRDVTSLIIGDNIETLPANAFRCFSNLQRVVIGTSVRKIGTGAFYECNNLLSCYFLCDFGPGLNYSFLPAGLSKDKFVVYHSASANGWENIEAYSPFATLEVWSSSVGDADYDVCLPEEKTILRFYSIVGEYYFIDSQGIKYDLDKVDKTATVIGYSCNNQSISTITIPEKVYYDNVEYKIATIESNAFSTIDCYNITSISILASAVNIKENAFTGCIKLDAIYFESDFPNVSSANDVKKWINIPNNNSLYFVTLDEGEYERVKDICLSAGVAGVYYANKLEENRKDVNGIIYTLDSKTMQAIVGEKTPVDETGINTSGSTSESVDIPDFVSYNNRIYMVTGFDRYAFYQSPIKQLSFGKFIGYYETNDSPAIWDDTFREMENLEWVTVRSGNEIYFSDNGILYSYGLDFVLNDLVTEEEYIRSPLRLVKAPVRLTNPDNPNKVITDITVKKGTTIIERYAFSGSNVEKIDLAGAQIIGSNAFNNCIYLKDLVNTQGIYYIESYAFANTKVQGLNFLAVSYIGDGAFLNANLNGEVSLSKGVIYIGDGAFRDNSITKFVISGSDIYFTDNYGVLYQKVGDEYILCQYPTASTTKEYLMKDFDMKIIEIKPYAFSNSEYLEKVTLSDYTKIVGSFAFEDCTSLEEVYIGHSYYGSDLLNSESGLYSYGLFNGDFNLKRIVVSDKNENFNNDANGVLYSKDFSVLYCYPAGLERSSYTVSEHTKEVYSMAFYYNHHIRRVIISNLEFNTIGDMAFSSCDGLEEIYFGCEIPTEIGNKIFDNTTLAVRYKEGYDSWNVYEGNMWNGAEVSSYEVITELSNSRVDAEDYLFVVVGTDGKPIEGAEFSINVGDNSESIVQYTDEEGLVFFSKANFEKSQTVIIKDKDGNYVESEVITIPDISIDIYKEDYFSYKQDIHLDFTNNITYITLTKLPSIFGVSCDNNDINSEEFILNISEYGKTTAIDDDYVDNEMAEDIKNGLSNDEILKKSQIIVDEVINVVSVIYYDGEAPQYIILHQNGNRVVYKDSDVSVVHSISNRSLTYTFTINPKDLLPDTPLEVGVLDESGEILVSQALNVSIIALTVNSDDINLEFPEQDVDMGQAGEKTDNDLLGKLIGIDNMNIKVSKNVKFTTKVDGNRVTLTLKANHKSSSSVSNSEDFEAKYKENVNKYGRNTYYFTYNVKLHEKEIGKDPEKHSFHIVIRFGLDTIDDGYSYYRLNVYDKPDGKVLHTLYGRVNADSNLRYKFGIKSGLIFAQFWSSVQEKYQEYKKTDENKQIAMEFSVKKNAEAYIEPYKKPGYSEHETKHSFEASLSGSITFEWKKGEGIKLIEGSIVGSLNYTLEHSSQFIVVNVPVVLEIELSIGGTLTFKFNFDREKIIDPTELSLQLELEISASVGVGCSLASVGLYGKIGTIFIFDIIPQTQIRSWEIHGEVGLYFKILWFRYDLKLFSGQYYIIDNRGEKTRRIAVNSTNLMYLADEYSLDTSTDFEEMSYMFIHNEELYKIHFLNAQSGSRYDEYNNRKLAISHWDNEKLDWDKPEILDDNGLNDGSFAVYAENDKYYLTYTQQMRKLDSQTANDTYASASNMELKVLDLEGYISGENVTPSSVRKNSYYKYLETAQMVNGKLTVAWVENADNNIFGVSPKNYVDEDGVSYSYATTANSLYISQFINNKWVTMCLKDGLSTITDVAITKDGIISYIVDTNADLASSEDRVLHYIDLSSITVENVLNQNGIINLEQYNGEIIYYYETEIDDKIESGFKYIDLNNPYANPVSLPENIKVSNAFTILKKENDIYAILYALNETWEENGVECVGSALYGIFYDNGWGTPIKLLSANDNEYITSFSSVIHDTLKVSLSYSDKDGNIIRNTLEEFDMNSEITVIDFKYDYANRNISLTYKNIGLETASIYYAISGSNKKFVGNVLPGDTVTYVVEFSSTSNLFDFSLINGDEEVYTKDISFEYVDLSISTKQVVIGEDDVLLVCIKNEGNQSTNAILYVNSGYLTANQIVDSKYVMRREIEEIEAGKAIYYNVILDPYLLSTGRVTLYIAGNEYEKDYLVDNNVMVQKLNKVIDSENVSSLSSTYEMFDLDDMDDIVVSYVASNGYALKEVNLDVNAITRSAPEITWNDKEITFNKNYLMQLPSGTHTFNLVFEGEYGKQQILYLDIEIETKYKVLFDVYGNGNTTKEYLLEKGEIPKYDGEKPYKSPIESATYEFAGWDYNGDGKVDSLGAVYQDITYVAVFSTIKNKYSITWVMQDGLYTEEIYEYDMIPSYKGQTDSFISNNEIYTFVGWDKNNDGKADELLPVRNNVTYKALYTITKHKHQMEYHPAKEPTYVLDGNIEYYTCIDEHCNNIYYEDINGINTLNSVIIPKLSGVHNYILLETIIEATCTKEGKVKYQCENCGEIHEEVTPKLEHVYLKVVAINNIVSEATCQEKAKYYLICSCGHLSNNMFESGETIDHQYTIFNSLNENNHEMICHMCSKTEVQKHNWNSGQEIIKDGVTLTVYSCIDCNYTKVEDMQTEHHHNYITYTDYNRQMHSVGCECGHILYEEHKFDDGVETIIDGLKYMVYVCEICHFELNKNIGKPEIIDGKDQVYNGKNQLTITSSADVEDFIEIRINGEVIDNTYYSLAENSTTITLSNEYLNSLEEGSYKLEIVSINGVATTHFSVSKLPNNTIIIAVIASASVIVVAFAIIIVVRRKNRIRDYIDD